MLLSPLRHGVGHVRRALLGARATLLPARAAAPPPPGAAGRARLASSPPSAAANAGGGPAAAPPAAAESISTAELLAALEARLGRLDTRPQAPALRPSLVVISGPSGVGKDAVIGRLKQLRPDLHFVVTATSRRAHCARCAHRAPAPPVARLPTPAPPTPPVSCRRATPSLCTPFQLPKHALPRVRCAARRAGRCGRGRRKA